MGKALGVSRATVVERDSYEKRQSGGAWRRLDAPIGLSAWRRFRHDRSFTRAVFNAFRCSNDPLLSVRFQGERRELRRSEYILAVLVRGRSRAIGASCSSA